MSLQSVGIAVRLLDAVASLDEAGPSELARRLGVAKSTAHRTCGVLADAGLLRRIDGGRYRLGLRLVDLGARAAHATDVGDHALGSLARLRAESGETVQVGVADGAEVVYVERVEGLRALRVAADDRRRGPVHRSSVGKVLAAFVPGVLEARLAAGLPPSTGYTIAVPELFRAEVDAVARRGWARSIDETELGMSSLAVPVRSREALDAPVTAAISMVGPTPRIVGEHERRNLAALHRAACEVGAAIGQGKYSFTSQPPRSRSGRPRAVGPGAGPGRSSASPA